MRKFTRPQSPESRRDPHAPHDKATAVARASLAVLACLTAAYLCGCSDEAGGPPAKIATVPFNPASAGGHGTGLAKSPWPKFHADAGNTGIATGSGAKGVLRWQVEFGYADSAPAIGPNGTLYVGSSDGTTDALNPATGAALWSTRTGGFEVSSPAVGACGLVYIGGGDGAVYALNARTGGIQWRTPTGGHNMGSSPAIGPNGTVYIGGGDDGDIFALNGLTGAVLWKRKTGGGVDAVPAISPSGLVYAGSYDHYIYALSARTGALVWRCPTGGRVGSSAAIGPDGTVYEGSYDQHLYALNGATGAIRWTAKVGAGTGGLLGLPSVTVSSDPAVWRDGTVYVIEEGSVFAFNGATGAAKWQTSINGEDLQSSPVLASDGTVYAGSNDGYLYALNGATGAVLWRAETGEISASAAVGANGTVYVGSDKSNELSAIQ